MVWCDFSFFFLGFQNVDNALMFLMLTDRGRPRLGQCPRLEGVYSFVSPRLSPYNRAHTHAYARAHTRTPSAGRMQTTRQKRLSDRRQTDRCNEKLFKWQISHFLDNVIKVTSHTSRQRSLVSRLRFIAKLVVKETTETSKSVNRNLSCNI